MDGVEATGTSPTWRRLAERVAIVLLAVLLVGAILRSARDVQTYVGIDLVPKIGGAQRFFAHVSPYAQWDDSQTGFLPDMTAVLRFSRCSYPPTVLLFYRAGAWADYRFIRYAWASAEWIALLLSITVLVVAARNAMERWSAAFVGIVCFACGYFFRLHVERGQYYVFVTLFWALAWRFTHVAGLNNYASGFFLGLAAALRPTSIVALVPLAMFRKWRALSAALTAFATTVAGTLAIGGPRVWTEFAEFVRYVAECTVNVPAGPGSQPSSASPGGYDPLSMMVAKTTNTAVLAQLVTLARAFHAHANAALLSFIAEIIVAAVMLVAFARMARAGAQQSDRRILLWSMFIALICDFAAPVRYGYADVLYLVPIAVSLPYLFESSTRAGASGWAGPLIGGGFLWAIAVDVSFVSTSARSLCVMSALALVLFTQKDSPSPGVVSQRSSRALSWTGDDAQQGRS